MRNSHYDSDRLDHGEPMSLPLAVVRDMLERLTGGTDGPVHESVATADVLYHLHRGKLLSAREAARRWGWGKTRAAIHIADTWRTKNGDSSKKTPKARTLGGQRGQKTAIPAEKQGNGGQLVGVADTWRTLGGQSKKEKFPPHPLQKKEILSLRVMRAHVRMI